MRSGAALPLLLVGSALLYIADLALSRSFVSGNTPVRALQDVDIPVTSKVTMQARKMLGGGMGPGYRRRNNGEDAKFSTNSYRGKAGLKGDYGRYNKMAVMRKKNPLKMGYYKLWKHDGRVNPVKKNMKPEEFWVNKKIVKPVDWEDRGPLELERLPDVGLRPWLHLEADIPNITDYQVRPNYEKAMTMYMWLSKKLEFQARMIINDGAYLSANSPDKSTKPRENSWELKDVKTGKVYWSFLETGMDVEQGDKMEKNCEYIANQVIKDYDLLITGPLRRTACKRPSGVWAGKRRPRNPVSKEAWDPETRKGAQLATAQIPEDAR